MSLWGGSGGGAGAYLVAFLGCTESKSWFLPAGSGCCGIRSPLLNRACRCGTSCPKCPQARFFQISPSLSRSASLVLGGQVLFSASDDHVQKGARPRLCLTGRDDKHVLSPSGRGKRISGKGELTDTHVQQHRVRRREGPRSLLMFATHIGGSHDV